MSWQRALLCWQAWAQGIGAGLENPEVYKCQATRARGPLQQPLAVRLATLGTRVGSISCWTLITGCCSISRVFESLVNGASR